MAEAFIHVTNPAGQGPAGIQGPAGAKGDTGSSGISTTGSASYYSDITQGPFASNSIQSMTFNNTDWQNKILLQNGSQIKFSEAGKYNIAFSAQLEQTASSAILNIWLRKNGVDVSNTNTKITVPSNNPFRVAAWNFFVDAKQNDYYELIWSSTDNHTRILAESAGIHPAIPSIILTVNQIG